jgi:hypothetical protein
LESLKIKSTESLKIASTSNYAIPLQHYNFVIQGIPKILAIVLANEMPYSVSEIKLADRSKAELRQERLHLEWTNVFYESIRKNHPNLSEPAAGDLAVRNAGYLKSAFSPIAIEYSVDLRNLGFIINKCKRFISRGNFDGPKDFFDKLCVSMAEFVQQIEEIFKNNLKQDQIDGSLVSFERVVERDSYGNGAFNRSCLMSLDCLFDVLNHNYNDRISCSWFVPIKREFIVPHIIREYGTTSFVKKWQNDINSIADLYPLGMLVKVSESGLIDAFDRRIKRTMDNSDKLSFEMVSQACALLYSYKNALKFPCVIKEGQDSIFPYLDQVSIKFKDIAKCNCVNPCK